MFGYEVGRIGTMRMLGYEHESMNVYIYAIGIGMGMMNEEHQTLVVSNINLCLLQE